MKTRILVIDDEASIRRLLTLTLGDTYHVIEARDGREGLHYAAAEKPELIILDMGLPDKRGGEVMKELRSWSEIPVIVLSVENDPALIVQVLDAGADDYVTKPFRAEEFLARVRVCLRRTQPQKADEAIVKIRNLEIDLEKRIIKKDHEVVHLTATEYSLLVYLLKNQGKVVTHGQILKSVWGPTASSDSSYPRVYMRHLRQKLEKNPDDPQLFVTETGVGYRLLEN